MTVIRGKVHCNPSTRCGDIASRSLEQRTDGRAGDLKTYASRHLLLTTEANNGTYNNLSFIYQTEHTIEVQETSINKRY